MAEKRYYWLKLKEDYFSSPKIKKLRKIAGGDTYTIIYLKMQLLSIKNGGIVEFEKIEPTLEEELALKLDEDLENVQMTLAYLKTQSLIELNDNSDCLLIEASDNIGSEGQSAERKRRFDLKQKEQALLCNASVTEVKRNSISISNSNSISNSLEEKGDVGGKETKKSNKFVPPTLEEIDEYAKSRNSNVDAKQFYEYFNTGNWVDSKGNKVKNWKQKFLTWEGHQTPTYPKKENKKLINTREYTKEQLDSAFSSLDDIW